MTIHGLVFSAVVIRLQSRFDCGLEVGSVVFGFGQGRRWEIGDGAVVRLDGPGTVLVCVFVWMIHGWRRVRSPWRAPVGVLDVLDLLLCEETVAPV